MKTIDPLQNLRVAAPCPISWEQMKGDDRVRFCDQCSLHVYNIEQLTAQEASALITGTEGRLCARIYRRTDGTVITKDCPVGLRAIRRRVARMTSAVFTTILAASSLVFGQKAKSGSGCHQQVSISRQISDQQTNGSFVEGTILDPNRAVIPNADIKFTDSKSEKAAAVISDDEGRFRIALAPGVYNAVIEAPGFKKLVVTPLTVGKNEIVTAELTLMVRADSVTVGVIVFEPMIETTTPGTLILSGDFIRRLPIP